MSRGPHEPPSKEEALSGIAPDELRALMQNEHDHPHRILGPHPAVVAGREGCLVRAFHPHAHAAECVVKGGRATAMAPLGGGLFAAFLTGATRAPPYELRFRFRDGSTSEIDDPYSFEPSLGELDLYFFRRGEHRRLWDALGAHPRVINGVRGTSFAVWAPNARRASVVGDFCHWDGRLFPMRRLKDSGVFELFLPGVDSGALYKYEIVAPSGELRLKADPLGTSMELPPGTASRVYESRYPWGDDSWMSARADRDPAREPMAIYEVHLGSWDRIPEDGNRFLSYREIAPRLVEHVRRLGFTHVELLPLAEHAYYPSWGYQITGFYAATARYGSPDDLRSLIDSFHQAGIGVILDWVPAHFPRDDFALRRFDGTALYEYEDSRLGAHPDWGTLIFNYARTEVRNFLTANALYWLREFHADGLRVDAVASMLYRDYSRQEGQWVPNRYGGRENLEALELVRQTNALVQAEVPGAFTVAEESTSWWGVTQSVSESGLGFTFKWNLGWMHDTLAYFAREPRHRKFHHDELTFAMLYEYSERFINPLSHDEVVHLKRSLLEKMPGDRWQKFANLRLLLAYQVTRPGKILLFMGAEIASDREWNHETGLPWHLLEDPLHSAFLQFVSDLLGLYRELPCLWQLSHESKGFAWIDCADREQSVVGYERRDGTDHVLVVLNLTAVSRDNYRVGAPWPGTYVRRLSSDAREYGGSDFQTAERIDTEPVPAHGHDQSLALQLPPLGALILVPASRAGVS